MVENVYTADVVEGARVSGAGTGAGTADGEGVGMGNTGRIAAASEPEGVMVIRGVEVEVTETAGDMDEVVEAGTGVPTKRRICGEVLDNGAAETGAASNQEDEEGWNNKQQHTYIHVKSSRPMSIVR